MSVSFTNFGNLIKIDDGVGNITYSDSTSFFNKFRVANNDTLISTINNTWPYKIPFSELSINGITPTTLDQFQSLLETLTGALFDKFDPLAAVAFSPTALTSQVRRVAILGNNPDVDQGSVPETVWPNGGLYPWMTGATAIEVVSTSIQDSPTGTGMGAISLTLLDIDYVASIVPVTLNGTTAVSISSTWFRINGGVITIKGSGAPATRAINVGDIIVRDAGGGTVRAIIPAGKGILRQAVFTTEAGYTLQVLSHYIGFNRGTGGGATRYLTVSNFIQNSSGVSRTPLDLSCNGEPYRHDGIPGVIVPEKTDYALDVAAVSADNSDITGAFLGVLVKNEMINTLKYP